MPLGRSIADPPVVRAGRVALRTVRLRDAARLEELLLSNRDWLGPWEATHPSGRTVTPGTVSMKPTLRLMRKQLRAGTGVPYVIMFDDVVVGQLSVSEVSGGALRSAQLGYWVAREFAGRGITPVAVALAIDYLFTGLLLHRAEVCIRPENQASLRVVEKLGLRYEGRRQAYIHIDGGWRDHECFAVTVEEAPHGMLDRLSAHTER